MFWFSGAQHWVLRRVGIRMRAERAVKGEARGLDRRMVDKVGLEAMGVMAMGVQRA